METLRTLSKIFMIFPAVTFFYDLVYGWFVKNNVRFFSLEKWWRDMLGGDSMEFARPFLKAVLTDKGLQAFMKAPACVSLLIFPVVFFVIYFIWFRINGGKGGSAYKFKSRH